MTLFKHDESGVCSLIVNNVNEHDLGEYTCRVLSLTKTQYTNTCFLNIEKPVKELVSPVGEAKTNNTADLEKPVQEKLEEAGQQPNVQNRILDIKKSISNQPVIFQTEEQKEIKHKDLDQVRNTFIKESKIETKPLSFQSETKLEHVEFVQVNTNVDAADNEHSSSQAYEEKSNLDRNEVADVQELTINQHDKQNGPKSKELLQNDENTNELVQSSVQVYNFGFDEKISNFEPESVESKEIVIKEQLISKKVDEKQSISEVIDQAKLEKTSEIEGLNEHVASSHKEKNQIDLCLVQSGDKPIQHFQESELEKINNEDASQIEFEEQSLVENALESMHEKESTSLTDQTNQVFLNHEEVTNDDLADCIKHSEQADSELNMTQTETFDLEQNVQFHEESKQDKTDNEEVNQIDNEEILQTKATETTKSEENLSVFVAERISQNPFQDETSNVETTTNDIINAIFHPDKLSESQILDDLQDSSTESIVINKNFKTPLPPDFSFESGVKSVASAAENFILNDSILDLVSQINVENKILIEPYSQVELVVAELGSTDSIIDSVMNTIKLSSMLMEEKVNFIDSDSLETVIYVPTPNDEITGFNTHEMKELDSPEFVKLMDNVQKNVISSMDMVNQLLDASKLQNQSSSEYDMVSDLTSPEIVEKTQADQTTVVDEFGNLVLCGKKTLDKRDATEEMPSSDQQIPAKKQKIADDQSKPQVPQIDRKRPLEENRPPKFTQKLTDQEFFELDNVHLDCYVEGSQPINISWLLNDDVLEMASDENIEIFREAGVCSLEIVESVGRYQGVYKCHATNEFGSDTTICQLMMVNKAPRFTQQLRNQEFYENQSIHLDCFVEGQQPISIEWFFKNRHLESGHDSNLEIYREAGVCSLQILTGSLDYQGEYKCVATNEFGSETTNCYLKTIYLNKKSKLTEKSLVLESGADEYSSETLEFVEPLRDQIVELGNEVFLDCSVKNIRNSDRIEWYFYIF